MKRILLSLSLVFMCFQFSQAQQIINTNTKSTCTYNGSATLQGCVAENVNAIFTFKENLKTFIHTVNGTDAVYTIVSKTYNNPNWTYRISGAGGVTYDLVANQTTKVFSFYPVEPAVGATVYKYQFN